MFGSSDIGDLHRSIEGYRPTPLVELSSLAGNLGVDRIFVKDESHRFDLKAFKTLGAAYACYRHVRGYLDRQGRACPEAREFYRRPDTLEAGEMTFCTATDGNHGRGVARTARLLRQRAVIYMPAGTVPARIDSIRGEGAEVVVVDGTYDDAVTRCASDAEANGWQVISDTSWPGYEEIPLWIMAGYLTLFREIEAVAPDAGPINLVFVQGGVGALAGAAAWYYRKACPQPEPRLVMVEPTQAACLLESIESAGALPTMSRGRQNSIMAGLNCGFPSHVSWPLIKQGFDAFLAISDNRCVEAMRLYYHPLGSDTRIVSGESGAAGLAGLLTLLGDESMSEARRSLAVGSTSTVLLLNTEGDTDPVSFRRLVSDRDT